MTGLRVGGGGAERSRALVRSGNTPTDFHQVGSRRAVHDLDVQRPNSALIPGIAHPNRHQNSDRGHGQRGHDRDDDRRSWVTADRVRVRLDRVTGTGRRWCRVRGLNGAAEGAGIRGMRERAILIGADLTLSPASVDGTALRLVVPTVMPRICRAKPVAGRRLFALCSRPGPTLLRAAQRRPPTSLGCG